MPGGIFITPEPSVLSSGGGDIAGQFLSWREFGFSELRQGNLPLWNPRLYGGGALFLAGISLSMVMQTGALDLRGVA